MRNTAVIAGAALFICMAAASHAQPYPTCRFVHGPIETAIALKRQHGIDPAAIREVTIATFKQSIEVSSRPQLNSSFDAVVSHQYTVALALINDAVALDQIINYEKGNAQARALMQKVRVVHDTALEADYPRCWPHRITVHMNDGQSHTALSEFPPGRVAPIPSAAVDTKFLGQCAQYLGAARAQRALDMLRGIGQQKNMRALAKELACA